MTEPTIVRRRPPPSPEELRLRELGLWPFITTDGRIAQMPAKPARRTLVLAHVAASFDPDQRYDENQVNELLGQWCDGAGVDHVTVRRYLIDEHLLTRSAGVYQRGSGG